MPRHKNSLNKKEKYNVKINIMDNDVLDKNFCSLKEIANELDIPYPTLTDIYEKGEHHLHVILIVITFQIYVLAN